MLINISWAVVIGLVIAFLVLAYRVKKENAANVGAMENRRNELWTKRQRQGYLSRADEQELSDLYRAINEHNSFN